MRSIPHIVVQHSEEAAILWLLRQAAVVAPHYTLSDLSKLDTRVEAHLQGLRIADSNGWNESVRQLSSGEIGEVFAAAVLAFESAIPARVELVLEAGTADPELFDGLVSALGWLSAPKALAHCGELISRQSPALREIGLSGMAVHRHNPGDALRKFIRDDNPRIRARAFRAAGELGRTELSNELGSGKSSTDPECRFWSVWSAALMTSEADALRQLHALATAAGGRQERALDLLIRRLPLSDAKAFQKELSRQAESKPAAILAAGFLGDPESITWLLEQMHVLPLARRAGEAFTSITGVDLAYHDLERKELPDFSAGPTEDPDDENIAPDPDENLPWPDPVLVQKWWEQNRARLSTGTRYLLGKPITNEWLQAVLRDGRQRQRSAAALELAIRTPGKPLFNCRAPGFLQIQLLGKPGSPFR